MAERIAIFGLGYVGSVTGAAMAYFGNEVIGCDIKSEKNSAFRNRNPPVNERGLGDILKEASGTIDATRKVDVAVAASDIGMICVGTPPESSGMFDTGSLVKVIESIGLALVMQKRRDYIIAIRSTMVPGTTRTIVVPALAGSMGVMEYRDLPKGINVVVHPEFMREGSAIDDSLYASRVVVGFRDQGKAARRVADLWLDREQYYPDWETAEAIKLMDNTWHALKVCFANEMGWWLRRATANTVDAFRMFLADKKLNLSEAYLRPGWAYGGSCLPKDVAAMDAYGGYDLKLLNSIETSNHNHIEYVRRWIMAFNPQTVVIYGMSFKKGTDDTRGSKSMELALSLMSGGSNIIASTTPDIRDCLDADVIVLSQTPTKNELATLIKRLTDKQHVIDLVHQSKPDMVAVGWHSPYWS